MSHHSSVISHHIHWPATNSKSKIKNKYKSKSKTECSCYTYLVLVHELITESFTATYSNSKS